MEKTDLKAFECLDDERFAVSECMYMNYSGYDFDKLT